MSVLYQECVLEEKGESNVDTNARVKSKVGILCLVNIEEKVPLKLTRLFLCDDENHEIYQYIY